MSDRSAVNKCLFPFYDQRIANGVMVVSEDVTVHSLDNNNNSTKSPASLLGACKWDFGSAILFHIDIRFVTLI